MKLVQIDAKADELHQLFRHFKNNFYIYTLRKVGATYNVRVIVANDSVCISPSVDVDILSESEQKALSYIQTASVRNMVISLKQAPTEEILRACTKSAVSSLSGEWLYSFYSNIIPLKSPSDVAYGIMFEMMLYHLARLDIPEVFHIVLPDLINDELNTNGESYWLHNAIGCTLFNKEQHDEYAYIQYALGSAKLRSFDEVFHISSGMDAIRPPHFNPINYADKTNGSTLRPFLRPMLSPTFVHLVAADSIYFDKYMERLLLDVARVRQESIALAVHAHIINPTKASLQVAHNLHKRFSWFGVSYNEISFSERIRERSRKSYFASARFIFAHEILELYKCGLLVTDIDIEVASAYDEVIAASLKYHAALSFGISSMRNYYPWLRVGAQLSIFQYSTRGKEIAHYISAYIKATWDPTHTAHNWLIDQTALWHAHLQFSRDIGAARLFMIGRGKK